MINQEDIWWIDACYSEWLGLWTTEYRDNKDEVMEFLKYLKEQIKNKTAYT
jgi:hypothetical protein